MNASVAGINRNNIIFSSRGVLQIRATHLKWFTRCVVSQCESRESHTM